VTLCILLIRDPAGDAVVKRSKGFGWATGDDILEAYPNRLAVEGGKRHLPVCRRHQLGCREDATLDQLVHRADADAEP
jgi:hypothetical protein